MKTVNPTSFSFFHATTVKAVISLSGWPGKSLDGLGFEFCTFLLQPIWPRSSCTSLKRFLPLPSTGSTGQKWFTQKKVKERNGQTMKLPWITRKGGKRPYGTPRFSLGGLPLIWWAYTVISQYSMILLPTTRHTLRKDVTSLDHSTLYSALLKELTRRNG